MTPPINQRMGLAEWAVLIFLSILWGGSFLFIKLSLHSFPPLTLVLLRAILSSLMIYAFIRFTGRRLPTSPSVWIGFTILGLLNIALPLALFAWSQQHIGAGLASILNATTPLFSVVAAHFMTHDEKASAAKIAGVFFGMAGVIVMIGGDALGGMGDDLAPQIACLIAAASYAFASIYARRFQPWGIEPVHVAAGQMITTALMLFPIAMIVDQPWTLPAPLPEAVIAMVALALFSTALAYILYFRLLETAGATNALLVTFLVPITAILLGIAILGEALELKHWAGVALIALGLAAIDGRMFSLFRAKPAARPG
ncbi:DMT family transporter [Sphingobium boeckii]|uniref:Drug/metabolite transporter (DMT)-like permease n=1 Tax=Sphingobium boeckii TaxID=1082345 RepID=A0A7W9AK61_9SPHN|nr:EamA family transporter [Sphingobium boeckii]MBB5686934.1 drug/metabolite transporter (DMT)-like permease [Sphingobium boeckii]